MDAPGSVAEILERNPKAFDAFEEASREGSLDLAPPARPQALDRPGHLDGSPGEPGVYRRVPEVIDAWFDSGSMPFAQLGLSHTRASEEFEQSLPGGLHLRGHRPDPRLVQLPALDLDAALRRPREAPLPTRPASCWATWRIAPGKKESKSKGNYTPPEIILDRVRLEFAVVAADEASRSPGRPSSRARTTRGSTCAVTSAKVRVHLPRTTTPTAALEVELRPTQAAPSPGDRI